MTHSAKILRIGIAPKPIGNLLFNVQALRAAAAFLIVFPHLGTVLRPTGWTEDDMVFGQFGVDLFFVISGFVMVHTTRRKPLSGGAFILNRAVRVAPLYWLLTLCAFLTALLLPGAMGSTRANPLQLLQSLAFVPFMKGDGLIRPVLHVGWTLNYEMYFYAIFALALWATRRNLLRTIVVTCVVLACQTGIRLFTIPTAVPLRFFTDPIMLEFCFGMLLGWAYGQGWLRLPVKLAMPLLIAAATALLAHRYLLQNGDYRPFFAGVPSLILVAAAVSLEQAGLSIRNKDIQLLGSASYSLYLSHPFVAQIVGMASRKADSVLISYLLATVTVLLAVVVGVVLFKRVEQPITKRIREALREQEPVTQAAAVEATSALGRPPLASQ